MNTKTAKQDGSQFVKIDLPLSVPVGRKSFVLNLNSYRNTHYRVLNDAKANYKALIWNSIPDIKYTEPVELIYTYYHWRKGRVDVSNVCSIIDKFASDVLTERGIIPDDNSDYIKRVTYVWGGVDKINPRCELEIKII